VRSRDHPSKPTEGCTPGRIAPCQAISGFVRAYALSPSHTRGQAMGTGARWAGLRPAPHPSAGRGHAPAQRA